MAKIPGGVAFSGFIAPTDDTDDYPVTDTVWGKGGLRTVNNLTERDAITEKRRVVGMLVYTVSDGKTWQLQGGITNGDWQEVKLTIDNIAEIPNRSHIDLQDIGTNTHAQIDAHLSSTSNPHSVTKTQVGLGNVDDVQQIPLSQKGQASGVAELDASGKVPTSQLPAYVDDVLEYSSFTNFPTTGETGKIYIALDTNLTYRWTGTQYIEISPSLALGETSNTAYRGDRGKIAYDHSQLTSGNPHNVTLSEVGGTLDHGSMNGLGDDDHPQYLRTDATRSITANWNVDGNNTLFIDRTNSRIGIGKVPSAKLDVNGGARIGYDSNTGSVIGRATVGYGGGYSDYAYFGHLDVSGSAGNYAVLQSSNGTTFINSANNRWLYFRISNSTKVGIFGSTTKIYGDIRGNQSNERLKIGSSSGYVIIGPANTAHCHFYTDRADYYFDKEIKVDTGRVGSYNEDLYLRRANTTKLQLTSSLNDNKQRAKFSGGTQGHSGHNGINATTTVGPNDELELEIEDGLIVDISVAGTGGST